MGITGLHKHKKKFWKKIIFQDLVCPRGGIVYIDAFCWLHDCGWGLGRTMYQNPSVGAKMVIERFMMNLQIILTSGGRYVVQHEIH